MNRKVLIAVVPLILSLPLLGCGAGSPSITPSSTLAIENEPTTGVYSSTSDGVRMAWV